MHAHRVDPRSRRHSHGLSVDLAVLYQYSISTSSARRRKGSMPSWIRSYLGHAQVRHQAKGSILRLVLLCLAQTPALAQSTANGTANATAECRCTNVCTGAPQYAVDDECDDGGPGAGYDLCEYGSDCLDCGGPRCGNSSLSTSYDYEGAPPFPPSPSMPPVPPGCSCNSSCVGNPEYSGDGVCDDGGPGADYNECAYATDCLDCGPDCRGLSAARPPGAPAPGPAPSPSPLEMMSPPPSMLVESSSPTPPWRPSGVVKAPSTLPSMAVGALAGVGLLAFLLGCRWTCARKLPPSCYARCRPPRKKGNVPEFAGTASLVFGGDGAQMSSSDSSKWKVVEDNGL